MANPSLKAQIEAAKSALASDLAAPSLVTPPPKPPMTPTTPIMARNDIATDAGSLGADATDAVRIPFRPTPFRLMANQRMPQMLPPWMSASPDSKPNY